MQTTLAQFNETTSEDAFILQSPKMLRVRLGAIGVRARPGALVAHYGEVEVDPAGDDGLTKLTGAGSAFLAAGGRDVHLVLLEDETTTVARDALLAVEERIDAHVRDSPVAAVCLEGTGWVALLARGAPVLLDVALAPTFAEPGAAIAWAGGVEATAAPGQRLALTGQGWVLVEPHAD